MWPESAVTGLDKKRHQQIQQLFAKRDAWLVLGGGYSDRAARMGPLHPRAYNAAFLLDPDGNQEAMYKKHRLVMFGEYAPLEGWLPWTKHLLAGDASYSAGPGPVTFSLGSSGPRFSPLICVEDAFPRAGRDSVRDETDFLLNITNDAWFGTSVQQWQHAAGATYRAVRKSDFRVALRQ